MHGFTIKAVAHDRRDFLRIAAGGIAAGSLVACRTAVAAPPLDADFLIDGVTVVPMTAEGRSAGQSLAVRGGLITAILPQAEAGPL